MEGGWWAREDSNLQPSGYEPLALTIELRARAGTRASGLPHGDYDRTLMPRFAPAGNRIVDNSVACNPHVCGIASTSIAPGRLQDIQATPLCFFKAAPGQRPRLSRNTACSPNRFQNHHGIFSRMRRPQALSATASSILAPET